MMRSLVAMLEPDKGIHMLIKQADDYSDVLRALEQQAAHGGLDAKRARDELRIRQAGIKGEKDAAYLIDFDYARSANWAVIHDLRVEHDGRTAQIDHVLINRWMDVYVLETKHTWGGIKITEEGEFLRWSGRSFQGMPSPLQQNERHIEVLRDVLAQIDLPSRFGLRIAPTFHSFVLVSSNARVDRPKRFDASRVIKTDQLKKAIWRDIDGENPIVGLIRTAAKIVSSETVEHVARQLASRHVPVRGNVATAAMLADESCGQEVPRVRQTARSGTPRIEPTLGKAVPAAGTTQRAEVTSPHVQTGGPSCKSCAATEGTVLYGRYGYYFKCGQCETNTAIRFSCQPGHNARLRKDGQHFYRECSGCGSSELYFTNPA